MIRPRELEGLYKKGENISAYLRNERGTSHNTEEIIEVSYDLQTGSYIDLTRDPAHSASLQAYSSGIAKKILELCHPETLLEAGVGEATTLCGVLKQLGSAVESYGFDISWSRVAYGRRWLLNNGIAGASLCTGSLLRMPFADNSIDVVYTSHSVEPNGGYEGPILSELLRVTKKFLVLLEPGYEFASEAARRRMEEHGYCRGLKEVALSLGCNILEHELFPYTPNPLNPTALTVIKKADDAPNPTHVLACP